MKKKIYIIALLGLVIMALGLYDPETKRRFNHATGRTSLRIDDYLPGAFVEHNLRGVDHLWRAFMAVSFSGGNIYFGKANDSAGELVESNFDFADLIYHASDGGDTVIVKPGVRRIYTNTGDVRIPEDDSTFAITIEESNLTIESSELSGTYIIYRIENGALNKVTYYENWIDTTLYPYTQYIYQDTTTGDSLFVPPDTLPRDRTYIVELLTYTRYSEEAWEDTVGDLHFVPPDTLPHDLEGWERDTSYHSITQHFWYDSTSELVYSVPPDILPTDSTARLALLDSTKSIIATFQRDSAYIGGWTQNSFGSFEDGWQIVQTVETDFVTTADSGAGYIPVRLTFRSYSSEILRGGRFMFFYDADIPSVEPEDDIAGMDYERRTAYIHDQMMSTGDVMGFSIYTDDTVEFGSFANWYSSGRTLDTLWHILDNPYFGMDYQDTIWSYTDSTGYPDSTTYTDSVEVVESIHVDSLYGDVAVYAAMDIPDIAPLDSFVITLGLLGGAGLEEEFLPAADIFRDDTLPEYIEEPVVERSTPEKLVLRAYPNPFNSAVHIELPEGTHSLEIYNIDGRLVHRAVASNGSITWRPAENIPTGIYLARSIGEKRVTGKLIYMK